MKPIRILLLSGGSLVGQNVLDSLADRRDAVELMATNSVATDVSLFEFDRVFLTPPTAEDPAAFARRLSEILDEHDPDLVIPCRDDDVVFLAQLAERRPDIAGRFLCGSTAAALASVDKWASWQFARDRGLPFAPTAATPLAPSEARTFADEHGLPLIAKPRWGFASRGVRILVNHAQILCASSHDGHVIQAFLGDARGVTDYLQNLEQAGIPLFHSFEGIKHSIQIVIAPDGTSAGSFCSRNVNRNGTSLRLDRYEGADAQAIADRCHDAFSEAGWRGPLNIQCQQTPDGNILIYEFNGRISGATAARRVMGFDELGLVVRAFAGRELPPSRAAACRVDTVIRRAIDIALRQDLIEQLERDQTWQGSPQ
ncbi:MAG: hypothetical protein WCF44_11320 [Candidatus Methylophosphatis roskildensis]